MTLNNLIDNEWMSGRESIYNQAMGVEATSLRRLTFEVWAVLRISAASTSAIKLSDYSRVPSSEGSLAGIDCRFLQEVRSSRNWAKRSRQRSLIDYGIEIINRISIYELTKLII